MRRAGISFTLVLVLLSASVGATDLKVLIREWFDPKTKSFQTWPIPSGGGVVRNMVATPGDRIYLACSGVNKVAIAEITR